MLRPMAVRRTVTSAIALAVSSLAALLAQQSPVTPPVFRTGVDVVQMDVRVLDRNRRPVAGLTAADFTVIPERATASHRWFDARDAAATCTRQQHVGLRRARRHEQLQRRRPLS